MLFMDEAIGMALSRGGQRLLTPEDLDFEDDLVFQELFEPAVREYQGLRPKTKIIDEFNVGSTPQALPTGATTVYRIRPVGVVGNMHNNFKSPGLPRSLWYVKDGAVNAPAGRYQLTVDAPLTIDTALVSYVAYKTWGTETSITFKLRAKFKPTSLTITDGTDSATDDGSNNITGDLVSAGSIDVTDLDDSTAGRKVSLTLASPPTAGTNLTVTFAPQNPYVTELSVSDRKFLELWTVRMLNAFAGAKAIFKIDGIPYDVNLDELLGYARELEASWNERIGDNTKWWLIGI